MIYMQIIYKVTICEAILIFHLRFYLYLGSKVELKNVKTEQQRNGQT